MSELVPIDGPALPALVSDAGARARRRFVEFFTAQIRNPNTRAAYLRAVRAFFDWCDAHSLTRLDQLSPTVIAAYIEAHPASPPTVKQHLAALRMFFDYLVTGHVLESNPAAPVHGPRHSAKRGKTSVLSPEQARHLLDSIPTEHNFSGLRDRALIAVMLFSFARVGAVIAMRVQDYYPQGKRWWFRLHEKGGKRHDVPAHHTAEEYLDAYLKAARVSDEPRSPLFRSIKGRNGYLTDNPLNRNDVYRMIRRRARDAGLQEAVSCHTFRATGITAYLDNGGTIEKAAQIANHESPRTTKLYDRTDDTLTLDEIERIAI